MPYLTATEAADLLRISPKTLERYRLAGKGPLYVRAGRRVLYRLADIEAWLGGGEQTGKLQLPGPDTAD